MVIITAYEQLPPDGYVSYCIYNTCTVLHYTTYADHQVDLNSSTSRIPTTSGRCCYSHRQLRETTKIAIYTVDLHYDGDAG